ncbi:MAG: hypothetical protein M1812_001540 [Candelaria pacifica]|nr:MAG: hypothetical protein M1812_001540 [Candelaria pacifica]
MALNLEKQLLFGTNTAPVVHLPQWATISSLPLNVGTIASVLYSLIYMLMEPVAGGLLAPILVAWTAYANHLTSTYGATANYWAMGLHIGSWLAQFIGHGMFEGRAPALLDNLVQAFILAPFFVWFEILFFFGYRPELKRRMDQAVQQEVLRYRSAKKGTSVNPRGASMNGVN